MIRLSIAYKTVFETRLPCFKIKKRDRAIHGKECYPFSSPVIINTTPAVIDLIFCKQKFQSYTHKSLS